MKKIKYGFTLAEILVVMGIIVFLLLMVIPNMKNIMPNHDKMLLKKAYFMAERIVNELVNDENLYPGDETGLHPLADTTRVYEPRIDKTIEGETKFCVLFKARITNIIATPYACSDAQYGMNYSAPDGGTYVPPVSFTTSDGIDWVIPKTSFSSWAEIDIDVNGVAKGVNCKYDATTCPKPDRFTFKVYSNGKITVSDTKGLDYLSDIKPTD